MQVQIADAGTLAKRLTISYTAAEVAERRKQLIGRLAGEVRIEGFRPGKAPRALLERRYGEAAQAQAEEALADEGLKEALRQHRIRPFGRVATESIQRTDGLAVTLAFEVFPAVAIPEPASFAIEKGDAAVADAEVEEFVGSIARRLGAMQPLSGDETVIEDDAVALDGALSVGGAEVRKLTAFNHLVGGYPLFGKAPAEVVAAFAGRKVGDSIAFDTVLPANFVPAEHAGKPASLGVTIASANRMRPAAIDDELAKKVGSADLAAVRTAVRERLAVRKRAELRRKQAEQLVKALIERVPVELPPKALAGIIADAEAAARTRAAETKEDPAKVVADIPAEVRTGLTRQIVLAALGDHLGIEVSGDDFRDQILMAAEQTGRRPQDIADQLEKSGQAGQVAMEIREAKAIEAFLDRVLAA